jgi:hypothetical protein
MFALIPYSTSSEEIGMLLVAKPASPSPYSDQLCFPSLYYTDAALSPDRKKKLQLRPRSISLLHLTEICLCNFRVARQGNCFSAALAEWWKCMYASLI